MQTQNVLQDTVYGSSMNRWIMAFMGIIKAEAFRKGESQSMRIPVLLRDVLIALIALIAVGLHSARADVGGITLVVYKGGWIIGGSAGYGTLNFHGRRYPLSVGGIDYGFLFGGSRTVLFGRVSNIHFHLTLRASMPRPALALRSAAEFAASYSPIRRARYWSCLADRSG